MHALFSKAVVKSCSVGFVASDLVIPKFSIIEFSKYYCHYLHKKVDRRICLARRQSNFDRVKRSLME